MAWVSNETKMDTGQLFMVIDTEDGHEYVPVTKCKVEIKTTVKNSACKMIEQERTYEAFLNGDFDSFPKAIWDAWMCLMEAAVKREMARIPTYPVAKSIREKAEAEWKPFREIFEKDINIEKETTKMENKDFRKPDARKCERCGKLFEVSPNASYCEMSNSVEVVNKTIELDGFSKENYNEHGIDRARLERIKISAESRRLDNCTIPLCSECRESLKNWWEHPESDIPEAESNG